MTHPTSVSLRGLSENGDMRFPELPLGEQETRLENKTLAGYHTLLKNGVAQDTHLK